MRQFILDLAGPLDRDKKRQNDQRNKGQHAGLLLQRYLCENATGDGGNPEEKKAILRAARNATDDAELRALYQAAYKRWHDSLPSDSAQVVLATPERSSRLIVGLGSENVLETGIRLHHTYGMPILPGSALKGLAAHYCDQIWGERHVETPSSEAHRFRGGRREDKQRNQKAEPPGDYHQLLFGTTADSGCIIFHDAWLIPDSQKSLVLDVMTPHHPKWLDGSVPPTDFDSPIPVPFLSVTGTFRVAVSWHGPASDMAKNWTELLRSLLCDALKDWGVGGKTTSGYGRLAVPLPPPPPPPAKYKTSDLVDAVLLEERTKKGGWKAQIKGFSQMGPIQNLEVVPAESKAGDFVKLIIASINDREAAFKWPQPAKK